MPYPLSYYVAQVRSKLGTVSADFLNMYNQANGLAANLTAEGNPLSGASCANMASYMYNVSERWRPTASGAGYWLHTTLDWIEVNWESAGGDVDMGSILDAMWASKNWETLLFVAYVDAMRGSVSEKTVTETNMANYLRHFLYQ